jgi:hypothetical protein
VYHTWMHFFFARFLDTVHILYNSGCFTKKQMLLFRLVAVSSSSSRRLVLFYTGVK